MGNEAQTQINTSVTLETNLMPNIEIPIVATMAKPQIVFEESVDFGYVQVGTQTAKSITIINPSDEFL